MALGQLRLKTGMSIYEHAIHLLQVWEPLDGYYLAFSGGKDSVVLYDLAVKAGVNFDAHYCVSPIVPPQIHKFIKEHYPGVQFDNHARNFWKLVPEYELPMRQQRWCCRIIKEAGGENRTVLIGNRRAEGTNRSKQCFVELPHNHKNRKIRKKNRTLVRPLLDFSDYDIWQYIRTNNLPYCSLYDEGAEPKDFGYGKGKFKRIGCVLCPFSRNIALHEEYFPGIVSQWKRACDKIVANMKARNYIRKSGKEYKYKFQTGEELYQWWVQRD